VSLNIKPKDERFSQAPTHTYQQPSSQKQSIDALIHNTDLWKKLGYRTKEEALKAFKQWKRGVQYDSQAMERWYFSDCYSGDEAQTLES
jgi:hypothetical protein